MPAARKSPIKPENIVPEVEPQPTQQAIDVKSRQSKKPSKSSLVAKSSLKTSPKSSKKSAKQSKQLLDVAKRSQPVPKNNPKKKTKAPNGYSAEGGASFDDVLEKLGLRRIKAPMA